MAQARWVISRLPLRMMAAVLAAAVISTVSVSEASGVGALSAPTTAAALTGPALAAPLHTNGVNSTIYDAANRPVRLVGFNWAGTEQGGRSDNQKIADMCGTMWRTPADAVNNVNFDNMYQVVRDMGYNVIRIPISWNNLRPVAPVWNPATNQYVHSWNDAYLNDLKSMVSKSRAVGLSVILDMHQDFWSPSLHHITNWDGSPGYCEGVGMPRWLNPSIDAKSTTTQNTDYYNGMNWFFRNVNDPQAVTAHASPWELFYSAWDQISYAFSKYSGFADYQAVVGADLINEPYANYVGGNPPPGQTVLQAAGSRLQSFYSAMAPAVTNWNPSWLLFFEDSTGGYNSTNPDWRETPSMSGKPTVPGNWVYSTHLYNFGFGTFDDGVAAHNDYGVTVANKVLANATSWKVPLYIGEFTTFSKSIDARVLKDSDMAETKKFLVWAKQNNVSWTFWSYASNYWPMTMINYDVNQVIPVVKNALDTGII